MLWQVKVMPIRICLAFEPEMGLELGIQTGILAEVSHHNEFRAIHDYISYLLLHSLSFESKFRGQGLVLNEIQEVKWERHISEHCIGRNHDEIFI